MSRYHDDRTRASDPGNLRLDMKKLAMFQRDMNPLRRPLRKLAYPVGLLDEHLQLGDSRAAVVVQTAPSILVAAYTDELDCLVILRFPSFVKQFYQLEKGTRLLTVNTYTCGIRTARDLRPGLLNTHRYCNYFPIIAEFLSNDIEYIERRKEEILDDEWQRISTFMLQHLSAKKSKFRARNGSPYFSMIPA